MDNEILNFLRANQQVGFYQSLLAQYQSKGTLSDRQIECVRKGMAPKPAAPEAVAVDLAPIHAMFDRAREAGLKRRAYRAEGLVITPAAATGRNPGSLYVVRADSDQYIGKVLDGKFQPTRDAGPADSETLRLIAANPSQVAKDYGRRTGSCSCCGRELIDPASIAAGIGPVCAAKWGL